ncbi:MAG: hypothetical protein IT416_02065 [Candidatus Pacebacteria bacterium]|nr:hypothetical protein [Candidatus Paceibacterota bacterium]
MKNKTDILIITTGQGHESLAQVMAEEIIQKTQFSVATFKYFPKVGIHLLLHRYAPWLMRLLAKPLNNQHFVRLSRLVLKYRFLSLVEAQLSQHRPQVVISTFYLLNPAIEALKAKYNFYFINLITDPKTMILLNPTPEADVNLTFDEAQATKVKELYPTAKTKVTGWFVKGVFETVYSQKQAKISLKMDPKVPVLLLTSGSLGNASPAQLLPKLLSLKTPVQIVLICGSNKLLKNLADNFNKSLKKTNQLVNLRVLGFTKEMDKYIKAADLVIGKAGPNTLFEAVATKTPFMAIEYGGQQEFGNQELIRGYNLGVVENRLDKIWTKLVEFIEQPTILNAFKPDLEKMKTHNLKAKKILVEELEKVVI